MPEVSCEIKPLKTCSFDDTLQAWNEGFQGYFVDMSASLDKFLARLHNESLSPEHSLLAFCDGRPAGILLNGIRESGNQKVAWNGGTGVSPEFRGRGIGKALMRATLNLYKKNSVEVATLEAISQNETAIELYKKCGYRITDRLLFLEHDGPCGPFGLTSGASYSTKQVTPALTARLEFYDLDVAWQAQWQSVAVNNGEAVIVKDVSGTDVGYALYKRKFDDTGQVSNILLYQCAARPGVPDTEGVVRAALDHAFGPAHIECRRSTYNLKAGDNLVLDILKHVGFKFFIEQVHMKVSVNDV
jgi:GNAT superfamily N-acetyltransferase